MKTDKEVPALKTVSPLVISASRATDIPAFQARWFRERLRQGFFLRTNPYNRKVIRVELDRARVIVFWTKNPAPLEPYLNEIEDRGLTCAFQYTVNDYDQEGWEPGLPKLAERVATFRRLAERLKPGAVVWRFDPLAVGGGLRPEELVERIHVLAEKISPSGLGRSPEKLVFSFLDLYTKVRRRLEKRALDLRPPSPAEADLILKGLAALKADRPGLDITSCAEETDLSPYGLRPGSCIEAQWLVRLCPDLTASPALFAPAAPPGLFDHEVELKPLKDKGQRPHCGCAPSQDIGSYNTCSYACVYCYAAR